MQNEFVIGIAFNGYYLLNLRSLLLGLVAWILPIINLAKHNKTEYKNWAVLAILSVIACAISKFRIAVFTPAILNLTSR